MELPLRIPQFLVSYLGVPPEVCQGTPSKVSSPGFFSKVFQEFFQEVPLDVSEVVHLEVLFGVPSKVSVGVLLKCAMIVPHKLSGNTGYV